MAPKPLSHQFVFLSILVVVLSNEAAPVVALSDEADPFRSRGSISIGEGWNEIDDLKDPDVLKIGNFTVTEHNKVANNSLEFVSVVKGDTQEASGTYYRLTVSAKNGTAGGPRDYSTIAWSRPWDKVLQLISFREEVQI